MKESVEDAPGLFILHLLPSSLFLMPKEGFKPSTSGL